jgi:hypothetical protein
MRAWLLLVLVACGSEEVDLTGVYAVDSAVGSEPCGDDAAIAYDAFVKFEHTDAFGVEVFVYASCTDEAAATCDAKPGAFAEPIDNGWLGVVTASSGGGGVDCVLGYSEQRATLSGSALVIELSAYVEHVSGLSSDECHPDEAGRRNTAMPCVEHTRVDATRI